MTKKKCIAVTFQRMKLGSPDRTNRPKAIPVRGDFLTLETDRLISAVGEWVDLSWIPKRFIKDDLIDTGSAPKILAGGDAVSQPRTIITAIASGKKAAISIDCSLRGSDDEEDLSKISVGTKGSLSMEAYLQGRNKGRWPEKNEVVSYQQINTLYFEPSRRVRMRKRHRSKVLKGFSEVNWVTIPKKLYSQPRDAFPAERAITVTIAISSALKGSSHSTPLIGQEWSSRPRHPACTRSRSWKGA